MVTQPPSGEANAPSSGSTSTLARKTGQMAQSQQQHPQSQQMMQQAPQPQHPQSQQTMQQVPQPLPPNQQMMQVQSQQLLMQNQQVTNQQMMHSQQYQQQHQLEMEVAAQPTATMSQQMMHNQQHPQQQQYEMEAAVQIIGPQSTEEINQSSIPSIRKEKGSSQRKRSRIFQEEPTNVYIREGLSQKESQTQGGRLDEYLQQVYDQVETVFAKGERGKTMYNKQSIYETLRAFGLELFKMIMSINSLQDEKAALQHQVIQLMTQANTNNNFPALAGSGTPATTTYLQAAMSKSVSRNINIGKRLPVPDIPNSLQHAPSERVIIFKAEKKGEQLTKEQKEMFRREVHTVIGDNLMDEVDVIRPTRNGGHTIIFQSEQSRAKALEALRENEAKENIDEDCSCIIAPKKKFAKVVCRDPPDNVSMDSVLNDFYSKTNVHLHQIPRMHRQTRIFDTRFGWIFEMSSMEAAAIQAQAGRIRYGQAHELRVEEYIPLQQCYRCCLFGHNAKDCTSENEYCRLCSEMGHMGWDCPIKDDKSQWKCTNCLVNNITKGYNLPINHAAAQLHKCPTALNQKEIKKAQLAASGIFTSPINEEHINIFMEPTNASVPRGKNGPQNNSNSEASETNRKGKSRSRSTKRNNRNMNLNNVSQRMNYPNHLNATSSSSSTLGSSSSSSSSNNNQNRTTNGRSAQYGNRMMRVPRPKSFDGWKVVGARQAPPIHEEPRGRDSHHSEGTNSMSSIIMLPADMIRPNGEVCPNGDDRQ